MLPGALLTLNNFLRRTFFISSVAAVLALSSCGGARPKGAERRYELKGRVVSVDRAKQKVVINHEAVPGFMEAMEMPFTLKDEGALQYVEAGDDIQAELVVTDGGPAWLEHAVVTRAVPGASAPASAAPSPGAQVPDFKLLNQDGRPLSLGRYNGKALLVTFIYTRCPLPEYCTLMSTNFAEINRELEMDAALKGRARLLSVSIDPARDTPRVLRSYGAAHTGKYSEETFDTWEFATGDPAEVRRLAEFFGLTYKEENDQIVHSLRTALVGPDGKLYKLYRGNEWRPAEVMGDMRSLLGAGDHPHGG